MLTPEQLAARAQEYGDEAAFADSQPSLGSRERTFECVYRCESHDLWLIRWGPGSGTPLHDHGDSAGAVYVVEGELVEFRPGRLRARALRRTTLRASQRHLMSRAHVHSIANETSAPAASVHVYSPPLDVMHHYEVASGLRVVHREVVSADNRSRLSAV